MTAGEVHLHAKVTARVRFADRCRGRMSSSPVSRPRRVGCLGAILPKNSKAPFSLVNRLLRKKEVSRSSTPSTAIAVRRNRSSSVIRSWRWGSAKPSGPAFRSARTTWSFPMTKWKLIERRAEQVKEFEQQYHGRPDHSAAKSTTRWSMPGRNAPTRSPTR